MANLSEQRHDTHSATASERGWTTKRIAITALFCAACAICTLFLEFPILPAAPWLKYDPSGVVALIAGLAFGPATGAVVSIVSYLPHLVTASGFWGMLMAIIATLSLVLPASLVYRKNTTFKGAITGLAVGAIICLACCIAANLIVTPIYAHMTTQEVASLIIPILLPFNVIKIAINCVICALIYKPVAKALGN